MKREKDYLFYAINLFISFFQYIFITQISNIH